MTDLWPKAKISQSVVLELAPDGWLLSGPEMAALALSFDEAESLARIVLNLSKMRGGEVLTALTAPSVEPSETPSTYQTVAQRVAGQIRQAILCGFYPTGARLDEVGLARAHGVSRTPVREALGQLASAGLVTYVPRKGCRVAALPNP